MCKVITKMFYLTLGFLLFACASPQIITATDTSISVDIKNTGMTTSEMIQNGTKVAQQHCSKYGKKANFVNTSGFLGAPHIATFECK